MNSRKSNGRTCCLAVISLIVFVSACAHKYVGREVDARAPSWCSRSDSPASCALGNPDEPYQFEFTVSEGSVEGEYIAEGTMDGSEGSLKSITALVESESRFGLVLAKDGVVVDYIAFSPTGGWVSGKAAFKRTFTSAPFDAVTVSYKVLARD